MLVLAALCYCVTYAIVIPHSFLLIERMEKPRSISLSTTFVFSFLPVLLLFLGPCTLNIIDFATYMAHGLSAEESLKLSFPLLGQSSWIIFRNLMVAPVSEELVFRGCICELILCCGSSRSAILISSTFFAASHCHHFIYRSFLYKSLRTAILETIIQFLYTLLFGFYSAWVFVRFGRIFTNICLHSFCNFIGTPDIGRIWSHYYRWPLLLMYLFGIFLFLYTCIHFS